MREADGLSTRGILNAAAGRDMFTLTRFEPETSLQPFIEYYWIIHYDLKIGSTYSQTILSYPNVHLAFEHDDHGRRAQIYGIPSRPYIRELRGSGRVLGVRFRAGGFYPYWHKDISLLNDTTFKASAVFGMDIESWMNDVLDAGDDSAMARQTEWALVKRLPPRDAQSELAARIVQEVMNDRSLVKVEQLGGLYNMSIRQLQRLFHKYVGVTPKWVIKRFRLQEVAERLDRELTADWAELALQMGYFDQAHFIKDFKSVIGRTPADYSHHIREANPKLCPPQ